MKKLIWEDNRKPIFKENIEEIEKKIEFLSLKVAQFCAKIVNEETMDVLDIIDEYYSEAQDSEAKIEEKNCLRSFWNQIISMPISCF